jgi:hypothetical protein
MKKLFILLMFLLPFACMAQDVVRNGKNFTKVSQSDTKEIQTEFTYTIKGIVYPIFISKNGACYIKRISKKTGKEYKQYLGEEISREICKEIGIEYKKKTATDNSAAVK